MNKNLHLRLLICAISLSSAPLLATEWNAVVSVTPEAGQFSSVKQALDAAPAEGTPWRILVTNGIWQERLVIDKPVTLVGQSEEKTIIEASTPAGQLDSAGKKLGTSRTSTVEINASGVTLENITLRNSFDFPANQALADGDPMKLKDTQAVALMISENVDQARFRHLRLEGYQDTFYSKSGSRSYFTDCTISGHVDFIFGSGTAVFERCNIIARARTDTAPPFGYITAPSTDKSAPYGLIFIDSKLTKEPGVPARSFALGRPWHPTTTFADGRYADPQAIGLSAFINSEIDDHIYGWDRMSGKDKTGETIWFYPEDSRFYEYGSTGPGANRGGPGYAISAAQAEKYSVNNLFSDWPLARLQ